MREYANKQAILFAIHSRSIEAAWSRVQAILDDTGLNARQQLRQIAADFFHAETQDVASMGPAAQELDAYLEQDAAHHAFNQQVAKRFRRFLKAALPTGATRTRVDFATALVTTVIDGVGRNIARQQLPAPSIEEWAEHVAEMLGDHLEIR